MQKTVHIATGTTWAVGYKEDLDVNLFFLPQDLRTDNTGARESECRFSLQPPSDIGLLPAGMSQGRTPLHSEGE